MTTPDVRVHRDAANQTDTDPGVTGLFSQLMNDTSELVRGEVSLARAEMRESVNDAKTGVISLVAGAVVLLAGLPVLMIALAYGITAITGLALGWSLLLVGLLFSVIGALMLKTAAAKFSAENLAPSRTADSLSKDGRMIKEHAQ